MQMRKLGSHGPEVSAIGLGCMGMNHHRGVVPDRGEMISLIRTAVGSRRGGGWNWVGVVSGSFNPNDSGVGALERRPRHDKGYHERGGCRRRGFAFR